MWSLLRFPSDQFGIVLMFGLFGYSERFLSDANTTSILRLTRKGLVNMYALIVLWVGSTRLGISQVCMDIALRSRAHRWRRTSCTSMMLRLVNDSWGSLYSVYFRRTWNFKLFVCYLKARKVWSRIIIKKGIYFSNNKNLRGMKITLSMSVLAYW